MSSDAPKSPVPAWVGLPIIVLGLIGLVVLKPDPGARFRQGKEDSHMAFVKSMSPLPEKPQSPDNPYVDNVDVAELGQAIFSIRG